MVRELQNRSDKVPVSKFEQECIALFSTFLHALGIPNSVGAIYGLLFASYEPICFSEIVAKLDFSKGSVSQGLAFLRQCGAVKVVAIAGDRREFFVPELGLRRLAIGLIKEKIQPLTEDTHGGMIRLKRHTEHAGGRQREFQMARIRQLETWRRQLGRVLPAAQSILRIPIP